MVWDLFDEGKPRVEVEVVAREGKVVVECASFWVIHVEAMRVNTQVNWWFAFAYVLRSWAKCAVAQVNYVSAAAVEAMEDVKGFPCGFAGEGFCRVEVPATEVLGVA